MESTDKTVNRSRLDQDGGWRAAALMLWRSELWSWRLILLLITLALLVVIYFSTYQSMVLTWWTSETYAHGLIIVPMSLYLIWRTRRQLVPLVPRTAFSVLLLLIGLNVMWLLGAAADALGVQQFAVTAMIPATVVLLLGWRVGWTIAFPLGILFLAVPIGDSLIPPLIHSTATIAVHSLRLTGIPVFWEGNHFDIPNGRWSVITACSGIHYLFAMLTLTLLYGYLSYRSYWRRAFIVVAGLALAIVGNGLRAYIIVMIGYLSNMHLAVGIDHVVYGWIFFGVLSLLLFWLGSFLREREPVGAAAAAPPRPPADAPRTLLPSRVPTLVVALIAMAIPLGTSVWMSHLAKLPQLTTTVKLSPPNGTGVWRLSPSSDATAWQPIYVGAATELDRVYRDGNDWVGLHLAYYPVQHQGAELVNFHNVLVAEKNSPWILVSTDGRSVALGSRTLGVSEARISSSSEKLLVWHWYWINGNQTSSPYVAKFYQAINEVLYGYRSGAGITVFTRIDDELDLQQARGRLRAYLRTMLPGIENALHGVRTAASENLRK